MTSSQQESSDAVRTLASEFSLAFNDDGQLRELDATTGEITDRPFTFDIHNGDKDKNQKRYESIGHLANDIVFHWLETKGQLQRITIPNGEEHHSFVFATEVGKLFFLFNFRLGHFSLKIIHLIL